LATRVYGPRTSSINIAELCIGRSSLGPVEIASIPDRTVEHFVYQAGRKVITRYGYVEDAVGVVVDRP
jgi:hypothetical protein